MSVSEGGVYRFLTLLEDDFDALVRWREQINAMPPSSQPVSAAGMIESIDPYYTQSASDAEALGEDFQDLVNQIRGLCRRIESVNYTTLPDLGYEPSN